MVKVAAYASFNMLQTLNLGAVTTTATGFNFQDNVNASLFGTTFNDVAAYEFYTDQSHLAVFGGKGFAFDANHLPTAGTVTGIALTDGSLAGGLNGQIVLATLTGFATDATVLGQTIASPDPYDDLALVQNLFKGNDSFVLSSSNDVAYGFAGNDVMKGGDGTDFLYGGSGTDKLFGGYGNDYLDGGEGNDFIYGDAGFDFALYNTAAAGQTIDLRSTALQANGDTLKSIEGLYGSNYNDNFHASDHGSTLLGLDGNDTLTGGIAIDHLNGGYGNDTLIGGAGKDHFAFDVSTTDANADIIRDFEHRIDKFDLSPTEFRNMPIVSGHLASAAYYQSATAVSAHDADDRIIYNTTTGALYYDSDGKGGLDASLIAHLTAADGSHPAVLSAADFLIV